MSTSASSSEPEMFQCTFSNVTQKNVESSRKRRDPRARDRARNGSRDGGHASDSSSSASSSTRAARDSLSRHSGESGVPSSLPVAPLRVQRDERVANRGHVFRPRDDARARVANQLGRRAVLRHDREHRPLGGEVLEHLPRQDAAAAAAGLGDQQQQRVGVALEPQRLAARDVVDQLDAVGEAEALHELPVGRTEVAEEAHGHIFQPRLGERTEKRLRIALPEERARMRQPEAVGARVLDPGEVVEVAAVRDRDDPAARIEPARLDGDRLGGADDRIRLARDEMRDPGARLLLRARADPFRRAVRVQRDRVAQVGHPLRARRLLHRRADQVHGAGRRRRQHDVDPLAARDRERLRDGRRVPGHVLVGQEQPAADRRGAHERELDAAPAVLLVGDPPPARPDVARAVDPRLRRQRQVGVLVHPLRIVRREHVRLDPERGQMARELQRALHAAAAGGREIESDEEELHSR